MGNNKIFTSNPHIIVYMNIRAHPQMTRLNEKNDINFRKQVL